jgi:hypothetical protein
MQAAADPSTHSYTSPSRSPLGPLGLWLLLQLLALGVSAARIPFFAKSFPQPAELLATGVMLVVQIGAAALLFPYLLRDFRAAVMVVAASWPFIILAGFLTGQAERRILWGTVAYVTAWLLGLAVWRSALRSARAQAAGVAVATLVSIGGPLLWYLRAEYGVQSSAVDWTQASNWGPIMGALSIAATDHLVRDPWFFAGGHLLAAFLAMGISRMIGRTAALPV